MFSVFLFLMPVISIGCFEYKVDSIGPKSTDPVPALSVWPERISFGAFPVGESSVETVFIQNIGDSRLQLHSFTIEGSTGFDVVQTDVLSSLEPEEQTQVIVDFTANEFVHEAALVVNSNAGNAFVPLIGHSQMGVLTVTPNPLYFENIASGERIERELILSNIGHDSVVVDAYYLPSEIFSVPHLETELPLEIAPEENAVLAVAFSPVEEGQYSSSLWLRSTGLTTSHVVDLVGSAGEGYEIPEPEEDPCLDPDSQYDLHPEAKLKIVDNTLPIAVEYTGTSAGYTSSLWLDEPREIHLATGHTTTPGNQVSLIDLQPGVELRFRIDVLSTGDTFYSGPAYRNPDGQSHVAVTYVGECHWRIGFEDMYGGGDQDFDDITLTISGNLEMQL